MTWKDAILHILQQNKKGDEYAPMHYRDITNAIIEHNLIKSKGKTPANTVSAILTGNKDLFESLGDGEFKLTQKEETSSFGKGNKKIFDTTHKATEPKNSEIKPTVSRLIQSYGMYWMRDGINWHSNTRLLGVQSFGAGNIDLSEMRGIYMLYDGREVIYVGQATDSILKRLIQHTKNRLATRWDRFSWFGIDVVGEDGKLVRINNNIVTNITALVDVLEGILIEGLEPRQNRRLGDNFGFEYYQAIDREITKSKILSELAKLS